jgi:ABC-type lipoprotein release transport system permease subunit
LWASGFLNTVDDSPGVSITAIDPASSFHDPIRQAIVDGEYLDIDDREGVLIGRKLAEELGIAPGSRVSQLVGTSDGEMDEDIFTVRGVFATGLVVYDSGTVYMPLPKAQAITRAGGRISAVILLEAGTLARLGTILGVILGLLLVWYLSFTGFNIGDEVASLAEGMAYPSVLYTKFAPGAVIGLSLAMLGIVLLAALYPARFAAKMEPVEALHAV